jgi:hypothetical protein
MTKQVLVLCQRKTGSLYGYGKTAVEDLIVPQINDLVRRNLGDDVNIEYLTNIGSNDGSSDYNFILDKFNPHAKDFISNHQGYYSLIILNTCPYFLMDYQLIYNLLEPQGIMVFTIFPTISFPPNANALEQLTPEQYETFLTFFEPQPNSVYIKKYKKPETTGGNRKIRRSKKIRYSKKIRRSKKIRSRSKKIRYSKKIRCSKK